MNVAAVGQYNLKNYNSKPNFAGAKSNEYENPINRSTEKNLAILSSMGMGIAAGGIAAGIGSCFVEGGFKQNKKLLGAVGVATGLATVLFTLPKKYYDATVGAFTREKEMDVFSRDRELKSNIMDEVNKEVQDDDVDLDKKISHYATVQMANRGVGLIHKEV